MGLTQNLGLLSTAIKATSTLNVGIGTSSPTSPLHILSTTEPQFKVEYDSTNWTTLTHNTLNYRNTDFIFKENATERLRIRNGNLGIGTSNPFASATSLTGLAISDRGGLYKLAVNDVIYLSNNLYYDGANWKRIVTGGGTFIQLEPVDGGTLAISGAATGSAGSNATLTERIRIAGTAAGGVAFNHTNGYETKIQQNSQINAYYNGGGAAMYLNYQGNGGIYAGSSLQVLYGGSDERIKDNINIVDTTLNKVLSLTPKTFNYKDEKIKHKTYYGFIAQDVQNVFPELVNVDEGISMCNEEEITDRLSVESYSLVWASILVKAIQELKAENDTLKTRIENLENK